MKLLIIDGHGYAYRAFYAIRGLRSPAGAPTNAVFGFVQMLDKLLAASSPPATDGGAHGVRARPGSRYTHAGVVWDGGLSAERMAAWPAYKAQRPEMPPDLSSQIDQIVRYLAAAGVASVCQDGVEADDFIASVAARFAARGGEVVIASSDKDFMQLVTGDAPGSRARESAEIIGPGAAASERAPDAWECGDLSPLSTPQPRSHERGCEKTSPGRIGLLNPNDKSQMVWSAKQVRAKTGVEPAQVVDWLALVGDHVDNIPGVPGVGPKTAADLLRQFGSVTALYARLDEVRSPRLRAALAAAADDVRRNVDLVRLRTDLAGDFAPETFALRPADPARVAELFREWGFRQDGRSRHSLRAAPDHERRAPAATVREHGGRSARPTRSGDTTPAGETLDLGLWSLAAGPAVT